MTEKAMDDRTAAVRAHWTADTHARGHKGGTYTIYIYKYELSDDFLDWKIGEALNQHLTLTGCWEHQCCIHGVESDFRPCMNRGKVHFHR